MRPSRTVIHIATALVAFTSLPTGHSFAPAALLSLRAPGSALRSASEHASACTARPPQGLSALSMMAKKKPAKGAAGGAGFGAPKKDDVAPKKEQAAKESTGAPVLNFKEAEAPKTKGAEPSPLYLTIFRLRPSCGCSEVRSVSDPRTAPHHRPQRRGEAAPRRKPVQSR
jgi:hypothetical protein